LLVAAIAFTSTLVLAQVAGFPAPVRNLTEYERHYEYRDGERLFMVASGERLIVIIGESKYALRPAGTDAFTNVVGDPIPFLRNTDGHIVGFKDLAKSRSQSKRRLLVSAADVLECRRDRSLVSSHLRLTQSARDFRPTYSRAKLQKRPLERRACIRQDAFY
jgi:hypothetical protein